jgi:hypothetical protein
LGDHPDFDADDDQRAGKRKDHPGPEWIMQLGKNLTHPLILHSLLRKTSPARCTLNNIPMRASPEQSAELASDPRA